MVKEDSNQVSASFEAVQCILSSIMSPSIFRLICRHFNGSPSLCPINATSSSSYIFRLQYPRALHCRIVLIEKLKTVVPLGRKKKLGGYVFNFVKIVHFVIKAPELV